MLETAEKEFLSGEEGPFIGGKECGMADLHAVWMVKWALYTIGVAKEPGFGKEAFPKVHAWCDAFPAHDDAIQEGQFLSTEEATKQIQGSEYACPEVGIDGTDPLQFKGGEQVSVEMTDATPGHHPQEGKLVGLNASRIVLQLETGLRVHFPRIGYAVKRT
ncbi:hypothetical protein LTR32_007743 [Rachicladosporium monterosium]|uniref:DUF7962 domain-containing protein n=1 Tax=Rachicladosporium monterosium TaxID=1507873 RepID=A0ABR0KV94_9PEZI|nr:hypothetical protein LTR32_007743 [Rachicladosporium monterosium]